MKSHFSLGAHPVMHSAKYSSFLFMGCFISGLPSAEAAPKPMPTDPDQRREIRYFEHKNPDLATEVPVYAEYYNWRIQGKINGQEIYPTAVPVVVYDEDRLKTREVTTIPVGQAFEIKKIQSIRGVHYYSYELPQAAGGVKEGWVAGFFIERVN